MTAPSAPPSSGRTAVPISPDLPQNPGRLAGEPLSPAQARAAAASADARAAEARKRADEAKRAAKEARTAAATAAAEAARLRDAANPEKVERSNLTTAQAKARLLDAAKAIHPFADAQDAARTHPWTVVGVAVGAGAILGASGGAIGHVVGGGARVTAALLAFARPAATAFGKYAAAQFAVQQAAKAQSDAAGGG